MPTPEVVDPVVSPPSEVTQTASTDALAMLGAIAQTHALWEAVLKTNVFPPAPSKTKDERAARKTLSSPQNLTLLGLIWRESDLISEAELRAVGFCRAFSCHSPLNCHALAKRLAEDIESLARTQKRVETLVSAAEMFGLVSRIRTAGCAGNEIRATTALHQLMARLGPQLRAILARAPGVQ